MGKSFGIATSAANEHAVPVIDLFAGPGGLSEGFASLGNEDGSAVFRIGLSIEMEPIAHRTLELRALFRQFPKHSVPDVYYSYLRGEISRDALFSHKDVCEAAVAARNEARCAELGETPNEEVDSWISAAIGRRKDWVLIGGPPCQAYSLVGRARRTNEDPQLFDSDRRHLLYQEYLRVIRAFSPAVFVMENVKGILSTKHEGAKLFESIVSDLRKPKAGLRYELRSFVAKGACSRPKDYVVASESFGVPQARHRVLILGVRSDLASREHGALSNREPVTVREVLGDLPKLRSRLSKRRGSVSDSMEEWLKALNGAQQELRGWRTKEREGVLRWMKDALAAAQALQGVGGRYVTGRMPVPLMPSELRTWLIDERLPGACNHESRSHMASDLRRYLFASCFAAQTGRSPKLADFPVRLLPEHQNVEDEDPPFIDRFRVQLSGRPSTTVTSHIAKDGHAFVHPDPTQARSLTVREAARLQTFPDNYFFEGGRTDQFTQVGNAVPPFLAYQLAGAVAQLLSV